MMTALFYLLNVACSSWQSALGKHYAVNGGKASVFNINKALSGAVVFLVFGLVGGLSFHIPTLLFGLGYGVCLCISMYSGFKALSMGPMALTSIIASFSLIIPFIFGLTLWGEELSAYAAVGMLFLAASIILLNLKGLGGEVSLKWSLLAFLTLLANGICSLVQKQHQRLYPGQFRGEFMLAALLCVLLILTVSGMVRHGEERRFKPCPSGIISGIMNGGANYIVLYLSATEKASVLFPMVSVANVIAVWLLGRIVFKERLRPPQMIGLASGILSMILLNV